MIILTRGQRVIFLSFIILPTVTLGDFYELSVVDVFDYNFLYSSTTNIFLIFSINFHGNQCVLGLLRH